MKNVARTDSKILLFNRADQPQATPAVVAELDAVLNAAVAGARSDAEVSRWLQRKLQIKRRLVAVPADALELEATAALAQLREPA